MFSRTLLHPLAKGGRCRAESQTGVFYFLTWQRNGVANLGEVAWWVIGPWFWGAAFILRRFTTSEAVSDELHASNLLVLSPQKYKVRVQGKLSLLHKSADSFGETIF